MQIQYNDPNSTYWKDKYKTLPNEVGPYAENKEKSPAWMRSKGLRYGGQDGGGHFWVSKSGDIYRFDDVASGSSSDTENTNSNDAGNGSNYTSSGNNILNTNTVTAPLEPIMYWPGSGNTVDNMPRANPGSGKNYENGHIASSSAATGKFGITETGGVTNYGSVPRAQINSTTNEPYTLEDKNNYSPIINNNDADCNRNSNFYLLDRKGNVPDDNTRLFFSYMNDRAGGIFQLCDDGKVLLKKDRSVEEVKAKVSQSVSYILAMTINSAVEGGTGYNQADRTHKTVIKVRWPNPVEPKDEVWNAAVYYDKFSTSTLDLSDYKNCLSVPPSLKTLFNDEQKKNIVEKSNEIIQAAAIGHFIMELSSFALAQEDNNQVPDETYKVFHNKAIVRECEIISEMTRLDLKNSRYGIGNTINSRHTIGTINSAYFLKNGLGAVLIKNFVEIIDENQIEPQGYIIGAEIYYNKGYVQKK